MRAIRLATLQTDNGVVSYWRKNDEVYRLSEYEPVQFDIYGNPLGARWECSLMQWDRFLSAGIMLAEEKNKRATSCSEI